MAPTICLSVYYYYMLFEGIQGKVVTTEQMEVLCPLKQRSGEWRIMDFG